VAVHTFACFESTETKRLADLTGIRFDLTSALAMAKELISLEDADFARLNVMADALTTALVVRYSRAFVSGVRTVRAEDVLQGLSAEQASLHEELLSLRNKHVAHSVNSYEESQPVVRFCLDTVAHDGVYSVDCNHARMTTLAADVCQQIAELLNAVVQNVDAAIDAERVRLLPIARQMPLKKLLDQKNRRPMLQTRQHIDKRRKR